MRVAATLFVVWATIGLMSCRETATSDPEKVYRYWSGGDDPPMDVHIVQGRYWESAHWSKEFELYLEIYAPPAWAEALIRENGLHRADGAGDIPRDAPGWFGPGERMVRYVDRAGISPGVELYRDEANGHLFLHVLQL